MPGHWSISWKLRPLEGLNHAHGPKGNTAALSLTSVCFSLMWPLVSHRTRSFSFLGTHMGKVGPPPAPGFTAYSSRKQLRLSSFPRFSRGRISTSLLARDAPPRGSVGPEEAGHSVNAGLLQLPHPRRQLGSSGKVEEGKGHQIKARFFYGRVHPQTRHTHLE